MSYLSNFEISFVSNTLSLVKSYEGEFEATILVNCLLGLLVVPKEAFLQVIPDEKLSSLKNWGIDPKSIINPGRPTKTNPIPETLRGLVINLRHAVAHFNIQPNPATEEVYSFKYTNDTGFDAEISVIEMRIFVCKLATHLTTE
jgi:HEPN pEK499 p136